ncbi:aliphatic sulfonate ABC transporter substrate-binding protein [Agromyces sp. Q22]|uniref:Aliphatic sulfonate ABC transporter substrate-binding protein n=1 Tax=Agromyces kandeliae TaxID=2666141 RepID=A0A6L5R0U2_9MICO|nr:aliphatic sulfonate ABC transporter substrate-binding protein [Agromyces kandeliae]
MVIVPVVIGSVGRAAAEGPGGAGATEASALRLGYFANVTHLPALVGLETGVLADELDDVGTSLEPQAFAAGPAAVEALSAGAIDAAYLGPSPAINSFVQSGGASLRIVAGAVGGGAALVVRDGIDDADDLHGTTLATPQLGNTQDVALRTWLADHGLESSPTGAGDVDIVPTDNARTLQLFATGALDGAWLPEPWASRLVLEAGASVLVDEAELWPDGEYPTTLLVVRTAYLEAHPDAVAALVAGHAASVDWISAHADAVPAIVNARLEDDAGAPLPDAVLERALAHVTPTVDPFAATLPVLQHRAVSAGTSNGGDLTGIVDLAPLAALRAAAGLDPIDGAGLDGAGQDGGSR